MTSYRAHRVLAGTGDNPSSSGVMEKASKRVGTLGKLVQASFFDDAEEVRINVYIYQWDQYGPAISVHACHIHSNF